MRRRAGRRMWRVFSSRGRGRGVLLRLASPPATPHRGGYRGDSLRRRQARRAGGRVGVRLAIGILAFAEVLLLSGHAFRWARTSPRFSLREVVIVGHRALVPGALVRLTALSPGMNLFEVDLEGVRRRVESHPWVRRASVGRRLPHRLRIEIEERRPVAILRGEDVVGVDREGVILGKFSPASSRCLPLLEGFEGASGQAGEKIRTPGFGVALAAADLFAHAPVLRRGCLSVRRLGEGRLRLRALEGEVELLVTEKDMEGQAKRFSEIARRIFQDQRKGSARRLRFDLTFPGRIVVRSLDQRGGWKG